MSNSVTDAVPVVGARTIIAIGDAKITTCAHGRGINTTNRIAPTASGVTCAGRPRHVSVGVSSHRFFGAIPQIQLRALCRSAAMDVTPEYSSGERSR